MSQNGGTCLCISPPTHPSYFCIVVLRSCARRGPLSVECSRCSFAASLPPSRASPGGRAYPTLPVAARWGWLGCLHSQTPSHVSWELLVGWVRAVVVFAAFGGPTLLPEPPTGGPRASHTEDHFLVWLAVALPIVACDGRWW